MSNHVIAVPFPTNEPVLNYCSGSPEKTEVLKAYQELYNTPIEVPLYIDGKEIKTGKTQSMHPPHDHQHRLGEFHLAGSKETLYAIDSALEARKQWSKMPWERRAAIFLKAADLVAGPYRAKINAATMLAQSKNIHQAEIDAACEFTDFLRFNVYFMQEIYKEQPKSSPGIWNQLQHRPLEGFVYAISPFNFTAIAGNLPTSAAMMGNVVVWKPSDYQVFSAKIIIDILQEAGLPPGVINVVFGPPEEITDTVLNSPDFSGLHFTGSTTVFRNLWKKIGGQMDRYKTYPRIVGETGGKDFILAHPSAKPKAVATAIIRGGFEFQGQKCSAASRVYLPQSKADEILEITLAEMKTLKMGSPEHFENFITAVIHQNAFDRLKNAIEQIKKDDTTRIIAGGGYDDSKGYFVEPTLAVTTDPHYFSMETELFGPLVTVYVYEDAQWNETLNLVDSTSPYALTGAVFSQDRYALQEAIEVLENSAGNFYINDKPTGAVVGQQPFGGARASGTNDKAGAAANLMRWVSPRLIKETFVLAKDYRYPFLST